MKFFFDNCISPKIASAIRELSIKATRVEHLRDRFDPSTPDDVWLAQLGREGGWTIISGDPRISKGRAERAAWRAAGLTAFFFSDGFAGKKLWVQASLAVAWWDNIEQQTELVAPGAGFLIPLKGNKLKQIA